MLILCKILSRYIQYKDIKLKIVLTIICVLSLAACSSTNSQQEQAKTSAKAKKTSAVICEAARSTGGRLKKRGC